MNKLKNLNDLQKGLVCLFVLNLFLSDIYFRVFGLRGDEIEVFQVGVGVVSLMGVFLFKSKMD